MEKVGIVGYSLEGFRDAAGMNSDEIVFLAARAALKNAGVRREDLDTVVVSSVDAYDGITISNGLTAPAGGGYGKDATRIQGGGVAAVMSAVASILSGSSELAMVAGGDAVTYDNEAVSNASYDILFNRPLGLFNLPGYAMVAAALLNNGTATEEDFALAAAKNYRAGADKPWAHIRSNFSAEEVRASPMAFWPLRSLEIAPLSKGASALVLASEKRARELTADPVWITGIAGGSSPCFGSWADLMEMKGLRKAVKKVYGMAGISDPGKQIDAFEIFSPAAPLELAYYEPLGICDRKAASAFLRQGASPASGVVSVNPSGGALCTNPANCGGIFRAATAMEYLRGTAGARRVLVQDSDIGLGFMGETYHVMVMEKENA